MTRYRDLTANSSFDTIVGRGLSRQFGRRVLWGNLDFTVEAGQMVALTGPSGSGKSTLLNCVGLLERVSVGSILVNGHDITSFHAAAARRFRRDTVGYLFQNYALVENATVAENLAIATAAQRRSTRRAAPLASDALRQVGLHGRETEPVYRLSGGEQQRVALARLIVKNPSIVLADEPTGALDRGNADMVVQALRAFADRGCAVLVATHSDNVAGACDGRIDLAMAG
ncbi:MAG: ATP-binding cassette domain-containing protein [Micropruina sp.]|uniref:ATP-binding cassette domain-containing protein n=1 Tax=Micropruina sp. TaxID=2737536 RepID=UPI0039E32808